MMEIIGLTMLHSLWQVALLWLLLIIVLRLWPRASSSLRYTFALATLGLCQVAVTATAYYEWTTLHPLHNSGGHVDTTGLQSVTIVTQKQHIASMLLQRIDAAAPWLAWLWFAGLVVMAIRFTGSFYYLHTLRRPASLLPVAPALQQRFKELTHIVGITRRVVLAESARITSPLTMGNLSPVVLLPVGLVSGLSTIQLEAVIVHELYHIKRRDYLVNIIQALVEVLLFYHPAVWHISSIVREERENCCDDLTLTFCGDPIPYARALTQIHETNSITKPSFAMSVTGPNGLFATRIKRLFNVYPNPLHARSKGIFAIGMLLTCMGLMLMSANALPSLPKPAPTVAETTAVKADTTKPATGVDVVVIGYKGNGKSAKTQTAETLQRVQVTAGELTAVSDAVSIEGAGVSEFHVLNAEEARSQHGEAGENGIIEVIAVGKPTSTITNATGVIVNGEQKRESVVIRSGLPSQNQPLFTVNGVVTDAADIKQLNPQTIESIEVYKGESALEKFGKAGEHGVVDITLKGAVTVKGSAELSATQREAATSIDPVSVHLYPNSARDKATVSFTTPDDKSTVAISVIDAQGNVVHHEENTYSRGKHDVTFDLSTYKKGIYMVSVTLSGTNIRQRLVVE